MDKIIPVLQDTPVTTERSPRVSTWYEIETSDGWFSPDELAWMLAQGWVVVSKKCETITTYIGGVPGSTVVKNYFYELQRQIIKPEKVLDDLIESYVDAYNEGRGLNDQRYDDIIVLYAAVLDKSEDAFNAMDTDDDAYENLIETLITTIGADQSAYTNDVNDSLDSYGDSLRLQIDTRFDNELAKAQRTLVDRGAYNSTIWTSASAGIERERTLALTDLEDKIVQQQLALRHKVYEELAAMRGRILAARDRLRTVLQSAANDRLASRNALVEALARFVERRTDSYPDLSQIGKLAASLGAGSPESYSP